MPIRCFTCGKVVANLYDIYVERCNSGEKSETVLDELKLGRPCCRRMLSTHVDVLKYQLLYPVYDNGVQVLGITNYSPDDQDDDQDDDPEDKESRPKAKSKAKVKAKGKRYMDIIAED